MILTEEKSIAEFRLRTLHKMLKLEILGMARRGQSAYAILKQETGLTGSKQAVYDKLSSVLYPEKDVQVERQIRNG